MIYYNYISKNELVDKVDEIAEYNGDPYAGYFCPYCAKHSPNNYKFCPNCGMRVEE